MSRNFDLWAPKFSQAEVGAATGVQVEKLRVWFNRGHLNYAECDEARGVRLAARLSARTAIRVAIIGAFTEMGVSPTLGNSAALTFMDVAENDRVTGALRSPGELFDLAETILCIYPDGSSAVHHSPLRIGRAFDLRIGMDGVRHATFSALALDVLYRDVLMRLEAIDRDFASAPAIREPAEKTSSAH